ncbi:hypothetical protein [Aureispira anguillae]|uniref:Uncharacterized protein n=1 Tax=Aureispira anguillae TaxID=2864201 RepID=A0A915YCB4_9BACT|nr:hypothetical protein [Aureispira anguillae]BDS10458.1 hypothetical protein AsAng_0011660 [Aureispira anguillae]
MNTITLKEMKCFETEDISGGDEIRLQIIVDGKSTTTLRNGDFDNQEVWTLNRSFTFSHSLQLRLHDEDWPDSDDHLGTHNLPTGITLLDATLSFTEDDADYELIFDLIPQNQTLPSFDPNTGSVSLYQFFSRMGKGVMNSGQHKANIQDQKIYQIGNEVVSIRDSFLRNSNQDRDKSNTNSIRQWVKTHCNFFSADTYLSNKPSLNELDAVLFDKNWQTVHDELSYEVAGFQDKSKVTYKDSPLTHETRDWNWDLIPDPQFMYLLGEGMKAKGNGNQLVPTLHNEWESGSFPIEWRPFWGEYITFWGRHVWDTGHAPVVTEIHPAHSIVREHTTASPIGKNNSMVPVNQAFIGMGLVGGFPLKTTKRWQLEFGGIPNDIKGDTKACWPTNLKKHPLKFKFYPPTDCPNPNATLNFNIKVCEHISVRDHKKLDDFLELAQYDDPAAGGKHKGFRIWGQASGFNNVPTPQAFHPKFTLRYGPDGRAAYYDVEIDLAQMPNIPVGYFAILECGWSERGAHQLREYEVTFESIKALETDEWFGDEWHLYYGVNGLWQRPWWTGDNTVDTGDSFTKNTKVNCWVLDDMPLVIRDTGIEWDGFDFGNEKLDTVNLVIKGAQHLSNLNQMIRTDSHLTPVSKDLNSTTPHIRFKAKGKGGNTSHQWTINIQQKQIV